MSEEVVFHFYQSCPIKDCINQKSIEGCYQFDDFPCEIITNWPDPLDKKIMLSSIPTWCKLGTEKWIEQEEKRYK